MSHPHAVHLRWRCVFYLPAGCLWATLELCEARDEALHVQTSSPDDRTRNKFFTRLDWLSSCDGNEAVEHRLGRLSFSSRVAIPIVNPARAKNGARTSMRVQERLFMQIFVHLSRLCVFERSVLGGTAFKGPFHPLWSVPGCPIPCGLHLPNLDQVNTVKNNIGFTLPLVHLVLGVGRI